jgi:hypothetical protein
VLNKTAVHWLITEFQDTGSVRDGKHVWHWTVLTGEILCNSTLWVERLLYGKSYLVSALLGMTFGHCSLHTSFCGDFSEKEFIWIMHKAWRNWSTILNKLHFAESHEIHYKGWMLVFQKVVDIFSICCKAVSWVLPTK